VLTLEGMGVLRKAEPAWRAAQIQVKDMLGDGGLIAVMDIASRTMNQSHRPLAPSDGAISGFGDLRT
jgi:hypothetical protein